MIGFGTKDISKQKSLQFVGWLDLVQKDISKQKRYFTKTSSRDYRIQNIVRDYGACFEEIDW